MAKYTTMIRSICEQATGMKADSNNFSELINKAAPLIFNFPYPDTSNGFKEKEKQDFQEGFLKHFFLKEIGLETVGLWKIRLQTKLCDIMPYYLQLYDSLAYDIEPFVTESVTEDNTEDDTLNKGRYFESGENASSVESGTNSVINSGSSSGNNTAKSTSAISDTPQGSLQDVESGKWMSQANIQSDRNQQSEEHSDKTINEYSSKKVDKRSKQDNEIESAKNNRTGKLIRKGFSGKTQAQLIMEWRQSLININMMIYDECNDLFMQIY